MTNLLVVRHHSERGSVTGTFGRKEKPFNFSWGSHNAYWMDKSIGDEGRMEEQIRGIVEHVFDMCAAKMLEQGIEDDGETTFIARINGKKVTRLSTFGEMDDAEFERAQAEF